MAPAPERDPLLETAITILSATSSHALGKVVLNKALFYADLYALRDLGRTMTGATYIAMAMGPVVDEYKTRLVGALVDEGFAKEREHAKTLHLVRLLARQKTLSPTDVAIAKKIGKAFDKETGTTLSAYSHKNPGWIAARQKQVALESGPQPINMIVALQGLPDEDPWLENDDDPRTTRALAKATATAGKPW